MSRLQMKTLLVTGASMGIGRALALCLARRGARLVLNARGEDALRQAADACRDLGAEVASTAGDCSDSATVQALVRQAQDLGDFAGFVHAAGVLRPGPMLRELDESAFDEVMHSHVRAAYMLAHYTYPLLIARDDAVAVFFGSGAGSIAQPGIGAYCVAKAAEEHLMRQLAAEEPQVTAFAYQPGVVETRMQVEARNAEGGAAERLKQVFRPWKEQGILLSPEHAARYLAELLDQDVRPLHGRVVRVDAGVI